jgi:hypothetical protein
VANNNQIYKMSNAGGFKSLTRYYDMLAGNTVWSPWEPQGAYDALATVTVPSGGAANVTFAGIPTGYKHLQIRAMYRSTVAGSEDSVIMRFNGDTGSNYSYHFLFGNGSSANASATSSAAFIYPWAIPGATFASNSFGVQVMDILDYANTSKNKTTRTLAGYDDNSTGGRIALTSGAWYNTSAVTSISITAGSANIAQYSSFGLYGVK